MGHEDTWGPESIKYSSLLMLGFIFITHILIINIRQPLLSFSHTPFFPSVIKVELNLDCSQSSIFPWDRQDRGHLTVNGSHLNFQMYWVNRRQGLSRFDTLRLQVDSVHLKIKMAARSWQPHGKTGLWAVCMWTTGIFIQCIAQADQVNSSFEFWVLLSL